MSHAAAVSSVLILAAFAPVAAQAQSLGVETSPTEVIVRGQRVAADLPARRDATSDTASLLSGVAGVAIQTAGGVSGRPVVHGLDDDRVRVTVDGMDLSSACANHMNPSLSYISPSSTGSIGVQSGVTPVSEGGDSLAGTITVTSAPPVFAAAGKTLLTGDASVFYRSNADDRGGALNATLASEHLSFRLDAGAEDADDYKDGKGGTVSSNYFKTRDLSGLFAYRHGDHLLTFRAGVRSVPGQGFANQQMDMIKNDSTFGNLSYEGGYSWGRVEAEAYEQVVHHLMNIGPDKLKLAGTMMMPDMPMNTRGVDYGAKLKFEIPTKAGLMRLGAEQHHFGLNDWWPPVAGTMMMAPNTFLNINDGHRDRLGAYAELESKLSSQWSTLAGVRVDQVKSDTHDVSGYNMMYAGAASAFNAQDHRRSDSDWDATLLARYTPDAFTSYEVAVTQKSRAPGLYERYAWGTDWMSSEMINWAGDGNAYVGNQNLRPEVAHTALVSGQWRRPGEGGWSLKLTPYYTQVDDYIDVRVINSRVSGLATINQLQFVNEAATLYGVDADFTTGLWNSSRFGAGSLHVVASYTHGENTTDDAPLYHILPLNGRVTLEQAMGPWRNAVEIEAAAKKDRVDPLRQEPQTGAYALINLRTAWQGRTMRVSLAVENLLDTAYALPLGGVNVDAYLASNWTGAFTPLRGPGRSVNLSLSRSF
ncbi:MAG: TonB-dependent receptor [Asticcacaulis sp.]|uniref:TonB-dependent receptor n=1 Tax=Asticcacaulis sp. TaxID=1872648 RepID=UPI003F7BA61F